MKKESTFAFKSTKTDNGPFALAQAIMIKTIEASGVLPACRAVAEASTRKA